MILIVTPWLVFEFQCVNGHLACSYCCPKLRNKCPLCAFPIGNNRCRAMETFLQSVFVPCRNVEFGCTKNVPYGRESNHEKEYCQFSPCSCPECNYTSSHDQVYFHYLACHERRKDSLFTFGKAINVQMDINDKILVFVTFTETVLFAVQCFREAHGVYVNVNCIAPPLDPEVGKFSYRISYSFDGDTLTHESPEMKKVLKVSFQIPQEKNFMFVSNSLLRGQVLEMKLCISEVEPMVI